MEIISDKRKNWRGQEFAFIVSPSPRRSQACHMINRISENTGKCCAIFILVMLYQSRFYDPGTTRWIKFFHETSKKFHVSNNHSGDFTIKASKFPLVHLWPIHISLIGTWLQVTAQWWVIWELSHSEAIFGIAVKSLPVLNVMINCDVCNETIATINGNI